MNKETDFKAIVTANQDRIYRICCCYIRDPQDRDDVYQKVLIHIWMSKACEPVLIIGKTNSSAQEAASAAESRRWEAAPTIAFCAQCRFQGYS
jgi:hypothetical protein